MLREWQSSNIEQFQSNEIKKVSFNNNSTTTTLFSSQADPAQVAVYCWAPGCLKIMTKYSYLFQIFVYYYVMSLHGLLFWKKLETSFSPKKIRSLFLGKIKSIRAHSMPKYVLWRNQYADFWLSKCQFFSYSIFTCTSFLQEKESIFFGKNLNPIFVGKRWPYDLGVSKKWKSLE